MDVVGVPTHATTTQNISVGRSSSPGLYGEVVLDHEYIGCGEGLGEVSFKKADMICCSPLSRLL
jgi:hypothetical protein